MNISLDDSENLKAIGLNEKGYGEPIGIIQHGEEENDSEYLELFVPMHESKSKEDPYLTILRIQNVDDQDIVTGLCRISLLKPEYIEGYNENMVLTDEDKQCLSDIVSSNCSGTILSKGNGGGIVTDISKWDSILDTLDYSLEDHGESPKYYRNKDKYKVPDYTKL